MPLRSPRRLPRSLNRPVSKTVRAVAQKQYRKSGRRQRLRKEWASRFSRRWNKNSVIIWKELKIWLIGFGVAGLLGLIGILVFSPIFNVKHIQIRRQDARIDIDDAQRALRPLFTERLPFITRAEVVTLLQTIYPDITQITMKKTYPDSLQISMYVDPLAAQLKIDAQRENAAGSGVVLAQSGSYAYITSKGYTVFSPVRLSKDALPTLIITDWGAQPANRTLLLDATFLRTIFEARDTLRENFGLQATNITVYLRAREFHITTKKIALWFDLSSPLQLQFGRFREFLKALSLDQAKEYIDLRISDRVIYK